MRFEFKFVKTTYYRLQKKNTLAYVQNFFKTVCNPGKDTRYIGMNPTFIG